MLKKYPLVPKNNGGVGSTKVNETNYFFLETNLIYLGVRLRYYKTQDVEEGEWESILINICHNSSILNC